MMSSKGATKFGITVIIYNRRRNHLSNYITRVIRFRISEYLEIIFNNLANPEVNNCLITRTYFTENVRPDPSHPLLLLLHRLQSRSVFFN